MHGMQLGSAGMHNQIRQWCSGGFLNSLINFFLDQNFSVWLTSDHGNTECTGKGRPSEGVLAEIRGERVRVYPSSDLRAKCVEQFPFSQEWLPIGLPDNYFPLVATDDSVFVTSGERLVGHGGISIEEVIVPLVKFERRTQ